MLIRSSLPRNAKSDNLQDSSPVGSRKLAPLPDTARSIFDDIDQG